MSEAVIETPTYRATVFHRTKPVRIVTSVEEHQAALADEWADTPAAFIAPVVPELPVDAQPAPDQPPADRVQPVGRRGRPPRHADRNSPLN